MYNGQPQPVVRNRMHVYMFGLSRGQGLRGCVSNPPQRTFFFSLLFAYHPIHHLCPSSSLSLLPLVAQIQGHTAGSSPPIPLRCVPLFSSRAYFGHFFPCRLASSCCAYPRCKALSTIESSSNKVKKARSTRGARTQDSQNTNK